MEVHSMFKILVVEDDKELNRTVCSFLDQSGYEVIDAIRRRFMIERPIKRIIEATERKFRCI